MFNKNDKIIVTSTKYPVFNSQLGEVFEIVQTTDENNQPITTFGVLLENNCSGHNLNGSCEFGYGWYFLEDEIELVNQSKLCRMIAKNEDLIQIIKQNPTFVYCDIKYQVRKNGALTFLTEGERKIFVFKDYTGKPLILKCKFETDRTVVLHLMDILRIFQLQTINEHFELVSFTKEQSDSLEAQMFPIITETPVAEIQETPQTKVYKTEEEIYKEMGITKK